MKTHFVFYNCFPQNAIYEIMWKITVDLARAQMTIWHMCISHWVPEATNTLSQNM